MKSFLALLAAAALVLAGCDSEPAAPPPDTGAQAPAGHIAGHIDWAARAGEVAFPNGWRMAFCEGEAPVLCVHDGGEVIGTVDLVEYPSQEEQSLEGRVAGFHDAMAQDRAAGCPEHEFTATGPEDARLGDLPAKRYGFTLTGPGGTVTERVAGWMADRGDVVLVLTADARVPEACPGAVEAPLLTPAQLDEAEGWLDVVAAEMTLPGAEERRQARVVEWDAGTRTVLLDEVAMLSGEEAVAAAREDGELAEGEDSLPNDFYIDDVPGEPVRAPVAAGAAARVIDCSAACEPADVSFDALLSGQARPFNGEAAVFDVWLRDGQVVRVAEIYFP